VPVICGAHQKTWTTQRGRFLIDRPKPEGAQPAQQIITCGSCPTYEIDKSSCCHRIPQESFLNATVDPLKIDDIYPTVFAIDQSLENKITIQCFVTREEKSIVV
jgi:hypothetical protein